MGGIIDRRRYRRFVNVLICRCYPAEVLPLPPAAYLINLSGPDADHLNAGINVHPPSNARRPETDDHRDQRRILIRLYSQSQ